MCSDLAHHRATMCSFSISVIVQVCEHFLSSFMGKPATSSRKPEQHLTALQKRFKVVLCSDLLMNASSHNSVEVALSGSGFQRLVITKGWHTRLGACCVTRASLPIHSPLHLSHDFDCDETVLTGIQSEAKRGTCMCQLHELNSHLFVRLIPTMSMRICAFI